MSFQGATNKLLNTVAIATKVSVDSVRQKKELEAKESELTQKNAEKQAKAEAQAKEQGFKDRIEVSKATEKAQKYEKSLLSNTIRGLSKAKAMERREFIHQQFDYAGLKSGKISPLEFQADYLEKTKDLNEKAKKIGKCLPKYFRDNLEVLTTGKKGGKENGQTKTTKR